jgi:hypothetical protein
LEFCLFIQVNYFTYFKIWFYSNRELTDCLVEDNLLVKSSEAGHYGYYQIWFSYSPLLLLNCFYFWKFQWLYWSLKLLWIWTFFISALFISVSLYFKIFS